MGKVQGILFFQGETDAVDPVNEGYTDRVLSPTTWSDKFAQSVSDIRVDLGNSEYTTSLTTFYV